MSPTISVIIPTLNEAQWLPGCLDAVQTLAAAEVIVVDGGSLDRTIDVARHFAARVVESPRGRGRQLNAGAAGAAGELLLFLHADCLLPADARAAIERAFAEPAVGCAAFRHRIDSPRWPLRLISAADNFRAGWLRRPYGDQGLVVRRELFHRVGGYPDVPILEDVLLVQRLRRVAKYRLLDATLLTDARRWERRGVCKTTAINWCVLAGAACGVSYERLARWYRGG
jgi:hypothetical protein